MAEVLEFQRQSFQWIFRTDFLEIDSFDLLAVQGILKSLLQHHNSKASILWRPAFFMVSEPYMTIGKTIALTIWTFVSKVMSLLFNTLSSYSWITHPIPWLHGSQLCQPCSSCHRSNAFTTSLFSLHSINTVLPPRLQTLKFLSVLLFHLPLPLPNFYGTHTLLWSLFSFLIFKIIWRTLKTQYQENIHFNFNDGQKFWAGTAPKKILRWQVNAWKSLNIISH